MLQSHLQGRRKVAAVPVCSKENVAFAVLMLALPALRLPLMMLPLPLLILLTALRLPLIFIVTCVTLFFAYGRNFDVIRNSMRIIDMSLWDDDDYGATPWVLEDEVDNPDNTGFAVLRDSGP